MNRTGAAAAALALALIAPAASSAKGTGEDARAGAAAYASAPASGSSNTNVRAAAKKRRRMTIRRARRVTRETAYFGYMNDVDATGYGATGCRRVRRWSARCIGFILGNGYNPQTETNENWVCDWFQRVWWNKRNRLRTSVHKIDCGFVEG